MQQAVAELLGVSVLQGEALSGGDLSPVVKLWLGDGRIVVAKGGPFPLREAAMLQAMKAAGVAVPEVIAVDERVLVLSVVADGPVRWRELGEGLARLHAVEGPRYGWREGYAFGTVPIDNAWCEDWPQFWADRRLRPFIPYLPGAVARRLEVLCDGLGERLPLRPRASLLHGDLWGGNVMGAVMIDPACYYGHGEVDLAILSLFGRVGDGFYEAYPVEPGWQERWAVYALWPALVHYRLFGRGYLGMVEGFLG